jgi:erythronate-4-phosphate dehydrogenase
VTLRILADENIPAVEHYAGALATVRRFSGRNLRPQELADADVLLVRSVTAVNAALLGDSPVRFVGTATSGVDHIDLEYLRQRGIPFRHAPGSNANSVVEYVLAALAGVSDHLERVLSGAPVGVVGYGVIGRAVVERLQALELDYRVYDPWLDPAGIPRRGDLAAILDCAVITLHAELTRKQPWPSHHLLDASALARIAPDSLLVNASRGPVVDNAALSALLGRSDSLDVVLDVWEGEPRIDHALLRQVRFGTPHIAGYSLDGKLLATRMLVEAMALELGLPWHNPGSAAGEPPPLDPGDGDSAAGLLRHLLSQRYAIAADDAALRAATLGAELPVAAAAFDSLRRDYPVRRELKGSRISAAARMSARARGLCARLGCVLPECAS